MKNESISKSQRENITLQELTILKKLAKDLLSLSESKLNTTVIQGESPPPPEGQISFPCGACHACGVMKQLHRSSRRGLTGVSRLRKFSAD